MVDGQVVIYLIADGRRDMQALLARRKAAASGDVDGETLGD